MDNSFGGASEVTEANLQKLKNSSLCGIICIFFATMNPRDWRKPFLVVMFVLLLLLFFFFALDDLPLDFFFCSEAYCNIVFSLKQVIWQLLFWRFSTSWKYS
ncbi:hypothetical protein RFI_02764 [Reticulomyxa filosa]|uniref:Uncharacterized protein n=1 Tax=Reticulomyxa filosa TaxID=46433 RepID=X6P8C9_RETFI|nr:hypothetical protein RFI_02764 [Reticulomyxa filosa]|eukprot:ETO34329.1 hypothetical protein RFI_02764 [Reticulomyxa filosa]